MVKYPKDNEGHHGQTHQGPDNIQGGAAVCVSLLGGGYRQGLVKVEHVFIGSRAPASWDRPDLFLRECYFVNIEFIYVKQKTVECISSKLLLGENVIMFLYQESESTGPFYIIKNTKCPLVLLKIKKEDKQIKENNNLINNHYNSSFRDIYINNFLSKYTLEFKKIKYNLSKLINSKNFIEELKENLYL